MSSKPCHAGRGALAVGAVLLALLLGWVGYFFVRTWLTPYVGYTPRRFSKEAWAAAGPEERGHMLDDLLARNPLVGLTRQEVRDLLGGDPPYDVGYRGFNPDFPMVFPYQLIVQFDDAGKVVRAFTDD
jgi:hypothetical protein